MPRPAQILSSIRPVAPLGDTARWLLSCWRRRCSLWGADSVEARRRPPDALPDAFRHFRIFKDDGMVLTERLYAGCVANRDLIQGRVPWRRL